jgi:serine carboxypeptidase-like clade 2
MIVFSNKLCYFYFQIGNPLLDFDIDFNSRAEFLWSHGLIADSTYQRFTKVCNYSRIRREARHGNTSVICDEVYQEVTTTISFFLPLPRVICLSEKIKGVG